MKYAFSALVLCGLLAWVWSFPNQKARALFYQADQETPLGIRFKILKKTETGEIEVPISHEFRSGERFRFQVESNRTGYIYLVHHGSSGAWKVLFPSTLSPDNRIRKGVPLTVPESTWYHFDAQAGQEEVTILFSLQPYHDLENRFGKYKTRDLLFEQDQVENFAVSPSQEPIKIDLRLTHR